MPTLDVNGLLIFNDNKCLTDNDVALFFDSENLMLVENNSAFYFA